MSEYRYNPDMVYREIGPETILVPVGPNVDSVRSVFTLNESAAFLLKGIRSGKSRQELGIALAAEFDCGDSNETEEWIDEIISEFRTNKIIV